MAPFRGIFDDEPPQQEYLLKGAPTEEEPEQEEEEDLQAGKLNGLDLDKELSEQYQRSKKLYQKTQRDRGAKASEKATVLKVCSHILQEIVKTQETLHNVQRLKGIELALISTLKEFPEVKERFLEVYEGNLMEEADA